jgi:antitoxin FitA
MEARMRLQLTVRNLDADLVAALKRRAAANDRSMEAEHREILREALRPGKDFWERVEDFRKEVRLPADIDTTAMIREDRDRR